MTRFTREGDTPNFRAMVVGFIRTERRSNEISLSFRHLADGYMFIAGQHGPRNGSRSGAIDASRSGASLPLIDPRINRARLTVPAGAEGLRHARSGATLKGRLAAPLAAPMVHPLACADGALDGRFGPVDRSWFFRALIVNTRLQR